MSNLLFDRPEKFFVMMKNSEIVHIAEVIAATKIFLNEVIESVEIDIGEKLAGEIADRNAD